MDAMVGVYNSELDRFNAAHAHADRKARGDAVDGFIDTDPGRISWTRALKADLAKDKEFAFDEKCLTPSLYRPFTRQWLYYSRTFNEMVYQMPRIFPMGEVADNRVICITGLGEAAGFSCLQSKEAPNFHFIAGSQCFPRYLYDEDATDDEAQGNLLAGNTGNGQRRDAITDAGLAHFQAAYPGESITKDDLFHYVYGLLHSEYYRERYADNLSKQLPRIPASLPEG